MRRSLMQNLQNGISIINISLPCDIWLEKNSDLIKSQVQLEFSTTKIFIFSSRIIEWMRQITEFPVALNYLTMSSYSLLHPGAYYFLEPYEWIL